MKKVFILIATVLLFPLVIFYSKEVAEGVINGIKVCFYTILPSLYIFTVLSIFCVNAKLLTGIKPIRYIAKIFNLNENCASVLLLSLFCGYPVGARLVNELYKMKSLNKKTAELLLSFTINPGPAFVISVIGVGIYNNKALGCILFVSAILTPLFLAFVKRKRYKCYQTTNNEYIGYTTCFLNAVNSANKTLATICGWVILGSVCVKLTSDVVGYTWLACLLEVTVGVIEASNISIYLVSFLIGFGGLCVHLQVLSAANLIKPSLWRIISIKTICGFINAITTYVLLKVFKISITTVNINNINLESGESSPLSSIVLMLFIVTTLAFLQRKLKNYGK